MKTQYILFLMLAAILLISCKNEIHEKVNSGIKLILDTDANNELDDQHALAYAFCKSDEFDLVGITVNSTREGGGIEGHYNEAVRIAKLCQAYGKIPIKKGAEGSFNDILNVGLLENYDGKEAAEFIIESSKSFSKENKLLIVAVGKLTNVALAIEKDSSIIDRIRLLWLGSNYPNPGEYNLENDTSALNPVFQSGIEADVAIVSYGEKEGTANVLVSINKIKTVMPGLGPVINDSIEGRNGGYYNNFGDYAVNLWENMELYGEQKERALYDLAALIMVNKPGYAEKKYVPALYWINGSWDTIHDSHLKNGIYYNFQSDSIINEFITTLEDPVLVN